MLVRMRRIKIIMHIPIHILIFPQMGLTQKCTSSSSMVGATREEASLITTTF